MKNIILVYKEAWDENGTNFKLERELETWCKTQFGDVELIKLCLSEDDNMYGTFCAELQKAKELVTEEECRTIITNSNTNVKVIYGLFAECIYHAFLKDMVIVHHTAAY